jgi:8-oxo-dGTP pyrophosphatase MutT (NUDIX family)
MLRPGAVAIIETPQTFVCEQRPEGNFAHAGETQLFGGHVEDEGAKAALLRELREELNFEPDEVEQVWNGVFANSQNKAGQTEPRFVTLFRTTVASVAQLELAPKLRDGGTKIVEIAKTSEAVEAARTDLKLTDFAYRALGKIVRNESWL